jgi:hypothetical protein
VLRDRVRRQVVHPDAYQKLHEFNLHIQQGVEALRGIGALREISRKEVRRIEEYFEEIRTSASGYLTSIFSGQEECEAGRLFGKRRRREMAEDPLHGGWLEEERERKRLKKLRKAKQVRKKNTRDKKTVRR